VRSSGYAISEYEVVYTYTYPNFSANAIVYTCTNASYYYALIRTGYVLHLLECLKCRIVGKSCSNVPRSLIAYAVAYKAART
jgi:hypothetical protein